MDKKHHLSFEFFPPKTLEGKDNLCKTALSLAELNPHFFSVTYGAGGSTREGTIDTINLINKATGSKAVPHISCIGATKQHILELLKYYKDLSIKHVVALRGDLPSGMGNHGELANASDLVALIRENFGDFFYIDVAAYPECHPQSHDSENDLNNFKIKVAAGANSAITQYFFNVDAYFDFVERAQQLNINIPIIPGIMPITNFAKLLRFSNACGAEIPRWIQRRLEAYRDDEKSIKAFGLEFIHRFCERLLTGGAPGLHFYTLNQAEASLLIHERLL